MPRILLTGIPSPRLFQAVSYSDFKVEYSTRYRNRRTVAHLREDFRVCGNTGNLLIGEGAAGALAGDDVSYLPFWYLMKVVQSQERVSALRASFDIVVMATANIIRPNYDAGPEADVLSAIELPTLLMGAGIQVAERLSEIPTGTMRLIEFLARR